MIAKPKLCMLLFLSSEGVFFLLLLLSFVYFRQSPVNPHGATIKALDVGRTSIFTACLLSSSLTVWLATRSLKRGNHGALRLWLLATFALGATFLYGEITEYLAMIDKHVSISRDVFSSAFFTVTGLHGIHVTAGLLALLILLVLAQGGDFKDGRGAVGVDTVSIYWHFVDGVWAVLFSTVYLWALFS